MNVPEPTNPRKRSLMPSSPLRRRLRAAGHHLSPVVQVGKEGVTEAVLRQLDRALLDHELVKVKAGSESPEDRFGTADALLAGVEGASLAQILGRTMLLYRRHPKKPRFEPLPATASEGRPSGNRPSVDRTAADRTAGRRSYVARPSARRPSGDRPFGNRPSGKRPPGKRPSGDRPSARRSGPPRGRSPRR
jgi:RNA-binding protein